MVALLTSKLAESKRIVLRLFDWHEDHGFRSARMDPFGAKTRIDSGHASVPPLMLSSMIAREMLLNDRERGSLRVIVWNGVHD